MIFHVLLMPILHVPFCSHHNSDFIFLLPTLHQVLMLLLLNWLQLYKLTFISSRHMHYLLADWAGLWMSWMQTLFLMTKVHLRFLVLFLVVMKKIQMRVSTQRNLGNNWLAWILMDPGNFLELLVWASLLMPMLRHTWWWTHYHQVKYHNAEYWILPRILHGQRCLVLLCYSHFRGEMSQLILLFKLWLPILQEICI